MSADREKQAIHRPRIYAHRGSAHLFPENTLFAFQRALNLGADVLETDVRISRDQRVIVTHDNTLERTTNGSGPVLQHTWKALKQLDAGYHAHDLNRKPYRGRNIRLMTLDELFEACPDVPINIDIKDRQIEAARLVAEVINRHPRKGTTMVASFHPVVVHHFRNIAPEIPTAANRSEIARLYFSGLRLKQDTSRPYAAIQVPVSWKLIPLGTRQFIKKVKREGTEICFWTINKPRRMRQLLELGADGLVTDRVDLAVKVLQDYLGQSEQRN